MGRQRSANREKAFKLFKEHSGKITSKIIAEQLGEKLSMINKWRIQDKWKDRLKAGAPKGNKNAVGNKGGPGAPMENQHARTMGWYSEYQPKRVLNIVEKARKSGANKLDIMWEEILQQWALIIDNYKMLHVKNSQDHTKVLKKSSSSEYGTSEEYEVLTAYDKQLRYTREMTNARTKLFRMIKDYDEELHRNWDLATEEQKARIEVFKSKVTTNDETKEDKLDKYFEALEGAISAK